MTRVSDIHGGTVDLSSCKYLPESCLAKYSKNRLQEGDLIICTVGSHPTQPGSVVGRAGIVPRSAEGSLLNQNAVCVRPKTERIDKRWLGYIGKSEGFHDYIKAHARGSASQVRMAIGLLKEMPIQVPDLPTQRKIAGILSAYDDLIENNLRRIKILEEMAQSLYREWFIHFRFPGHESAKFVDSSLGQIPKGWEVKAIEQVAIVHRGRSYRSSELLDDGGLPFINLKCIVRDGGFRRDGIKCFDGPYKDSHKVVLGDIVMAVTDMTQERRIVARAARIPTLDADFGIVSMDLVKIEPRRGVSSAYLYAYFRCSDFADHLKQHANGANVLHLSPDRIKEHQFVMPDEQLRKRYSVTAGLHFEKIENLHRRIDILRRSRDLLLPKLLCKNDA